MQREAGEAVTGMPRKFKVVLACSARQIGKTAVLAEHLHASCPYAFPEDPVIRSQAIEDAMLFFQIQEPAVCVLRHIDSEACPKGPEDLELWKTVQRESVPALYAEGISSDGFWSSHVQTYLERDMCPPINLKNERGFCNFMIAAAARSGQLFDAMSIASDIDAGYKTIQSRSSILQASKTHQDHLSVLARYRQAARRDAKDAFHGYGPHMPSCVL